MWARAGGDERLVPLLEEGLAALADEDVELRARLLARLAGALRDEHSRDRRDAAEPRGGRARPPQRDPARARVRARRPCSRHQRPRTRSRSASRSAAELDEVAEQIGDVERARERLPPPARPRSSWPGDVAAARGRARGDEPHRGRAQDSPFSSGRSARRRRCSPWPRAGSPKPRSSSPARARARRARLAGGGDPRLPGPALHALRLSRAASMTSTRRCASSVAEYPASACASAARSRTLDARLGRLPEARASARRAGARGLLGGALRSGVAVRHEPPRRDDRPPRRRRFGSGPVPSCCSRGRSSAPPTTARGSRGSVARYVGLLATTTGRWDEAEWHFDEAIALNERIGARPWLARTQDDYARMLLPATRPATRHAPAALSLPRSRPTASSACRARVSRD